MNDKLLKKLKNRFEKRKKIQQKILKERLRKYKEKIDLKRMERIYKHNEYKIKKYNEKNIQKKILMERPGKKPFIINENSYEYKQYKKREKELTQSLLYEFLQESQEIYGTTPIENLQHPPMYENAIIMQNRQDIMKFLYKRTRLSYLNNI